MSKLNLEKILLERGPCLTSELAEILVEKFGLTPVAARKRISRGTENIKKLSYIIFPHRARFIYLKKDYASPRYWKSLYASLKKENSSYYMAINAIRSRDGMVRRSEFGIICGSPVRQKNHIPYESIMLSLIKAEIILEISDDNGVKYLYLKDSEGSEAYLLEKQNKKEIINGIMIEQSRTWLRQLGLISFNKAKAMGDDDKPPRVGTFEWHITGPSYTHPLAKGSIEGKKPGFVVCDLNTTPIATLDDISTFIKKMEMTTSMKNIGSCIFIYISNAYTEEALYRAKSNGVMAITFSNIFGKRNAIAVEKIGELLKDKETTEVRPDELIKLTKELNERNGITQNLKGRLFEFICADIKKRIEPSSRIVMGKEYITTQGDKAEADITSIRDEVSICFIECKGIKGESTLDDQQVDRWLDIRIPRLIKYCKDHPDYKNLKKSFELWVTGNLTEESTSKIENFKKTHPRINVVVKKAADLMLHIKDINDRA
ncbi:TPA: hypothetical protein ACM5D1_004593, partial [Escherichia coli]|nr:hypothetical protein [Escherichia coli]